VGENGTRILPARLVEEMLTDQVPSSGRYGFGAILSQSQVTTRNGAVFRHAGRHPVASASYMASNPTQREGFVLMLSSGHASALRNEIYARLREIYGW